MKFGTGEYELIKTGDYEVRIDRIDKKPYVDKTTGMQKMGARFAFKIRDDIEQESAGRYVWEFFPADKSDPANWIDTKRIEKILNTQSPMSYDEKGKPQWDFEDLDSCIQYLTGAELVITVEKEFDDFKGEDVNIVKFMSYKKTQNKVIQINGNSSAEDFEKKIAEMNGGSDPLPF